MSQLDDIRAALVATLEGIPDIGRVHPFERYASRAAEFVALYTTEIQGQHQVRGWHVRRIGEIRNRSVDQGEDLITWRIRGFMALNDLAQSELVFDALIDAVMAAVEADETLGGTVHSILDDNDQLIKLESSEPVMFSGVLCHSAKLVMTTRSYYF